MYVRIAGQAGGLPWTIRGTVRGPYCQLSRTLAATAAIRDMGPGPTLLGRVAIPDPCFWSPRLPALYRLQAELYEEGQHRGSIEREIGFRQLGVDRAHFRFENRRWVLRAIAAPAPPAAEMMAWREAGTALVVAEPTPEFCRQASRQGLLLVARLGESCRDDLTTHLRTLAQAPAVAAAVLPDQSHDPKQLREAAGNLLLGQHLPADVPLRPADWADLVFCRWSGLEPLARFASGCALPLVAVQPLQESSGMADARARCDRLQADLARVGDFAGYVVSQPSEQW